ncbi:MAG: tRNA (adenosine(37)-N6)-threonylcarbamoyltransferase complex transferase subunit TsaD [bacterium]
MKILAIETSCDETAIAIVEAEGNEKNASFTILGNTLLSQIELHKKYGGVFPSLAKREHAKNLVPILFSALEEAKLLNENTQTTPDETRAKISEILAREPDLTEAFLEFISKYAPPEIDAIAVTAGPGLEPALWVGINFAKALAFAWSASRLIPLVAVNHMEGHILAALAQRQGDTLKIQGVTLPLLALLISGGHTQLVLMREWLEYELIGETRDDAVGEAFDKVARMLGLSYPGGPEISKLAELARQEFQDIGSPTSDVGLPMSYTWARLPRPMIHEDNCDFSFAGLKTAVLYLLKKNLHISEDEKKHLALEFENATADVLWHKTARSLVETGARTLVIGGGVSANTHIRRVFMEKIHSEHSDVILRIPNAALTTDNAIMIAFAGYYRALREEFSTGFKANGNLPLAKRP